MAQEDLNDLAESARNAAASLQQLTGQAGAAKQKEELARLDAATGIKNFGAKLNVVTTVITSLTKIAGEYYSAMADGKKGYGAMSSSIDATADALTAIGVAVLALSGPIGLLIGGIGLVTKVAAKYVKASAEQSDKLYDAYRNMSQVGATGSEGLQGVYSDMQKLGLGIQDLDKMSKLITENGKELALMGGSAGMGRQKFAAAVEATDPYRKSLMRLGMSQDAINEGVASYIRLASRMGDTQKKSFKEIADSAHEYILERDALTRITGMNMKEQEKALEQVRSQELFRSKLEELRAAKKFDEAKELETTYLELLEVNQTAAQGFADLATGNLKTEAAQKEMRVSQGKTLEVIQKISDGQLKSAEAADSISQAHVDTADAMGSSMAKMGNWNKYMGDFAGDMKMKAKLYAGGWARAKASAKTDQDALAAGKNKEIDRMVDTLDAQRKSMNAVQDFVRYGVGPATKAVDGFNRALGGVSTKVLPGKGAGAAPPGYTAPPAAPPSRPPTPAAPGPSAPAAPPSRPPATAPAAPAPAAPSSRPPATGGRPSAVGKPWQKWTEEDFDNEARPLVQRLQEYGITNQHALTAIIATARKESKLNYTQMESGAADYLATLNKRGIGYIYGVLPQLAPVSKNSGRVAARMGYGATGVPEDVIRSEWAKGDEAFFEMVYGGMGGNPGAKDGFTYRGRGYVQITTKGNYDAIGKILGVDLVKDPDAIVRDKELAKSAVAAFLFASGGGKEKALKKLNSFTSDQEALREILWDAAGRNSHKEAEWTDEKAHLYKQWAAASPNLAASAKSVAAMQVASPTQMAGTGPAPASAPASKVDAPLNKSSNLVKSLDSMRESNAKRLELEKKMATNQQRTTELDKKLLKEAS